ncbi:MAG: hypothetical protein LRY63_13320 [Nitrincola sp.]|nr:hypothetical protein [Nitrincola sp.]
MKKAWEHFTEVSPLTFNDFSYFCYHLPFSRMAQKAHQHLAKLNHCTLTPEQVEQQIADTLKYNQLIGNSYTASIYIGLCSLLDHLLEDLSGKQIGFFSYGSGCVAEFFAGQIQPGYQARLHTQRHQTLLSQRQEINYEEYLSLYRYPDPQQGESVEIPKTTQVVSGSPQLPIINANIFPANARRCCTR